MTTGQKTNLVGYFSLGLALIMAVVLYFGKITGTEFVAALAGIGAFAGVMNGFLTKSHSFELRADTGGHPDPDKEEK